MTPFTCFSSSHQGCGSVHRTLKAAHGCCKVAETRFGEVRQPVPVASRAEKDEKYPASEAAAARYAEWAAKNGVNTKGKPTEASAEPSAEPAQEPEPAQAEAGAGALNGADIAAAAATDAHPLAGLAEQLQPLLAPPIIEDVCGSVQTMLDSAIKQVEVEPKVIEVVTPDAEPVQIEGDQHENFELLLKLVGAGENVFMSGPAGSGKTTGAKNVAEALGMDLIVQPVALDKFEATGFIDAGGSYRESAVYRWATSEKPALLLLDEVDGWMPQALVALNPILDNRLGIFPGGQQFEIDPRHRVIATANTWGLGADAEYVGRNRLDAASLDRFGARIGWGYDEKFERKMVKAKFGHEIGKAAVDASLQVRKRLKDTGTKVLWGPRQTLGLAARLAAKFTLAEAFEVSALAQLADANRKRILEGIAGVS